jgi:putative transcriptional regulator
MTKPRERKYRNARLEVLHKTAAGLARIGALDKTTMRDFDSFCLTSVEPMTGGKIRALRTAAGVSQAVPARHLDVSTKLVSDWERDIKRPSGPSLKLLSLIKSKGLETIV